MKTLFCAFLLASLAADALPAEDPFVGKWVLDVSQSQYPSGTCPASMTIQMESAGHGVHYRSSTVYPNGSTAYSEYTADYDGNQAFVMGAHGMMLPVFLKRLDSRTVLASYTRNLQIVATSRRVVSSDAQSLTITTTSKDKSGHTLTTVGVYRRQMPS